MRGRLLLVAAMLAGVVGACGDDDETGGRAETSMDTSEPWDLVWFSDSTGFGVADLWAARIHDELGVEVRVHDEAHSGLQAVRVRDWMSTDSPWRRSDVREEVADAELIVFFGNPEASGTTTDMGTCVSTLPDPRDPPTRYSAADFDPYRDVLRTVYGTIFELRAGQPTIVRAYDFYNPLHAPWRQAGIDEECSGAWDAFNQAFRDIAAEYAVPLASLYDLFNGPDHDRDPREAGLIAYDGQHPSDEGRQAIVDAIDALGYEPVTPPAAVQ